MSKALSCRLLGLLAIILSLGLDQGFKFWMLFRFDIATEQPISIGPYFDIVMAWNNGISYGLFSAANEQRRYLLLGAALAATLALAVWLWNMRSLPGALALGLLIGGALGNAYDRYAYGAVADFFLVHVGSWNWYIFNIADCAIVLGVALLLIHSFLSRPMPKVSAE